MRYSNSNQATNLELFVGHGEPPPLIFHDPTCLMYPNRRFLYRRARWSNLAFLGNFRSRITIVALRHESLSKSIFTVFSLGTFDSFFHEAAPVASSWEKASGGVILLRAIWSAGIPDTPAKKIVQSGITDRCSICAANYRPEK